MRIGRLAEQGEHKMDAMLYVFANTFLPNDMLYDQQLADIATLKEGEPGDRLADALLRIEEAQAALADLKGLDPNLSFVRTTLQRLYAYQAGIDHLLDGLRKAGFE